MSLIGQVLSDGYNFLFLFIFVFWLQSKGGIDFGWCISGGNHSHLLGKEKEL
jgi:hypothetical protein